MMTRTTTASVAGRSVAMRRMRRRAATVYDETLIDLTGAPPISVGVAGEVLGLPVWEEQDDDDLDDDDLGDDDRDDDVPRQDEPIVLPSSHEALAPTSGGRPAPAATAPRTEPRPPAPPAPRPHRDTTPSSGISRRAPVPPDELDLAGLVASVDEADGKPAPETGGSDNDRPEAPQP
jgi:hypothetical protein